MKSWSWSWTVGLGLGLGLEEKVLQFFKTFVVILDGSEQGTPWHFVRQQKQFAIRKPSFERTFCAPWTSASDERIFNNGGYLLGHTVASKAHCIDCGKLLSLGISKPGKQTVHGLKCRLEKNATKISVQCTRGKWNPINKNHLQKRRNWTRWLNVWKRKNNANIIRWLSFSFTAENEKWFSVGL